LNTTLESLAEGVPLVGIPQGNDQPGVAARISHHQAGVVVPLKRLSAERLRTAIRGVLIEPKYLIAARRIQAAIREVDAVGMAADIVEDALGLRVESRRTAEVSQPA
jgi:UDP:flavonoid glycosyltransferase YjiC (YdhE family)